DNIDMNTGRCLSNGCSLNSLRFLRGRGANGNGTDTYGVLLESSPGAIVEQSAICANGSSGDEAAVRGRGDAANVLVHASFLRAVGNSATAVGFWADPCKAASPWLLNNTEVGAFSNLQGGRADGVRATGDCHPRIDSNVIIYGGLEQAQADSNGIFCVKDMQSMIASRCTVLNNGTIWGAGGGFPPTSTGVHCDDGACARIEYNGLITARGAQRGYGVFLLNTGTFVNANRIDAGCSTVTGVGLEADNSFARIQNNLISGSTCQNPNTAASFGVRVVNVS